MNSQSIHQKTVDETTKRLSNIERLLKKLEDEKKKANAARIAVINKMIEDLKREKAQLKK
jgi:hypothetical protein